MSPRAPSIQRADSGGHMQPRPWQQYGRVGAPAFRQHCYRCGAEPTQTCRAGLAARLCLGLDFSGKLPDRFSRLGRTRASAWELQASPRSSSGCAARRSKTIITTVRIPIRRPLEPGRCPRIDNAAIVREDLKADGRVPTLLSRAVPSGSINTPRRRRIAVSQGCGCADVLIGFRPRLGRGIPRTFVDLVLRGGRRIRGADGRPSRDGLTAANASRRTGRTHGCVPARINGTVLRDDR